MGHRRVDVVIMLRESCSINQFQMVTREKGVKKSEKFADIICGSSQRDRAIGALELLDVTGVLHQSSPAYAKKYRVQRGV